MRASVHVDLPGWTKHSVDKLKARCEELHLQPRGTRGESGGHTYDISNKHRLGYSEVELVQKMIDGVNKLWEEDKKLQRGEKVELYQAMPAQTNGPFPNIQSKHSLVAKHVTKGVWEQLNGNINSDVPVHSARIRVGRSIDGFGLSPGITKEQRVGVETLMKNATATFSGDLAGKYYPLTGMDEKVRQQLVDDHFLFVSGDRNLTVAGMERDWPEGRGIFHND